MLGQQAGQPAIEGLHSKGRKLGGSKGGVAGAADVIAAGHGGHVMKGGDGAAMAGQGRGMDRVAMQHRLNLRPAGQEIGVQPPLGGGPPLTSCRLEGLAAGSNRHQILRLHLLEGQGAGRDQQTTWDPHRKVAGGALVEPAGV